MAGRIIADIHLLKYLFTLKTIEPMKRSLIAIIVALAAFIFSCNPSKTTTTNSAPSSDTTNTMHTDTSTNNMNNPDTTHHR